MTRFRQTLLVLLLTILSGAMVAQNNTNSPYTRYGYGQLADQGSGNSKAMGGIAYGLRDRYQTNFANPASYTAVDSLTFMFENKAASIANDSCTGKIAVGHRHFEIHLKLQNTCKRPYLLSIFTTGNYNNKLINECLFCQRTKG